MNVYFPSAETDSAKQSINVDRATTAIIVFHPERRTGRKKFICIRHFWHSYG